MSLKSFLLLIIVITTGNALSAQKNASNFGGDTIEHSEYYKSGQLKIYDSYITQTPQYQYSIKKWYTANGTLILYDSIDAAENILHIAIYRKDGSPEMEVEERNPNYSITYSDHNGNPTDIFSGKMNQKTGRWQSFQNGSVVSDTSYNRFANDKYDTIRYYERVITKSNKQISKNYVIEDGKKFTFERHIRMVYNTDSILESEALYKSSVSNCGYFIQYYPDGTISCIGEYDRRGLKANDWYFFDEHGNLVKREHYYRGVNLFK